MVRLVRLGSIATLGVVSGVHEDLRRELMLGRRSVPRVALSSRDPLR